MPVSFGFLPFSTQTTIIFPDFPNPSTPPSLQL
jgi:hypothetical protein